MKASDWLNKGNKLHHKNHYEEAIACFDKAIKLNSKNIDAWYYKGYSLVKMRQHEEAIACFDKTIELNQEYVTAWNGKGYSLTKLYQYEEAMTCFDEAIKLNSENADAWYYKGDLLSELRRDEEAIACFEKSIGLNSKYIDAWNGKGYSLYRLGRYEKAIVCNNKVIELNTENVSSTWNNKGNSLYKLGLYEEAMASYNMAIKLNSKHEAAWNNKGNVFMQQKNYKDAANSYNKARTDVLVVLVQWNAEEGEQVAKYMLDEDDFFKEAIQKHDITAKKVNLYKNIYIRSLRIINLLHVEEEEKERGIAHYTTKSISQQLLFRDSNFRLHSATTSNDPTEGKTLLEYLFGDMSGLSFEEEMYGAFVGCFTFNHDSLNQFRLYGKEGEKEGTGVSLIVGNDFFSSKVERSTIFMRDYAADIDPEKSSLFRCIYLDPQTGHVVSIGQREEYTFYRGNPIMKNIEEYKNTINSILNKVRSEVKFLKEEIKTNELDSKIIIQLLIHLRYLTKHVAFKEEQECRVIRVRAFKDIKRVRINEEDYSQIYEEYVKMRPHLKKVCFGAIAAGMEVFKDILKRSSPKVICYRSEQPLKMKHEQ
jgi:tetratricopeptide (TPR) repeat protein